MREVAEPAGRRGRRWLASAVAATVAAHLTHGRNITQETAKLTHASRFKLGTVPIFARTMLRTVPKMGLSPSK